MRAALPIEELKHIYGRIARRYDRQHSLITLGSDQRGRSILVRETVRRNDSVLDCGAGTGATGLLAAKSVGPEGHVTMFDLTQDMLDRGREKVQTEGMLDRVAFVTGDMVHLPFEDNSFDAVLSTYSLCPLYDPSEGAREMYRVTKPGGRIGIAHSVDPPNSFVKLLSDAVEEIAWRIPTLSMGCRSVSVLPELERIGARMSFKRYIGVPLWPFLVFVVEKQAA